MELVVGEVSISEENYCALRDEKNNKNGLSVGLRLVFI